MGTRHKILLIFALYYELCCAAAFSEPITDKEILNLREEVREMFYFAYDSYMKHAYPYDELRPLTCDGHDTWGSYSLTLIDALDTLAVLGNKTEFGRVVQLILQRADFDVSINVSVFETNIRILGGLLSGHLLSRRMGLEVEAGWPCQGPLLRVARDVANRLLPAFDTPTGMPYGTVNLRDGVPEGETPVTCTAGVGTYLVEFGTLSRLTGDPIYEQVALRAMHAVWRYRSTINLVGNHIDVVTGRWTAQDSGIGAGVDSYLEYLVKAGVLLRRPELLATFSEARAAIEAHLRHDDWYLWATMTRAYVTLAVFQSLEAYWPGILSLVGDISSAQKIIYNYHQVWKQFGFTPEFYNIPQGETASNREGYPLRPELVESLMYLYQATRDPTLLHMGADIVASIQHSARTHCGYATVKNVNDHSLENRMESFFLAETTKYLFLLFDRDNWLHNDGSRGHLHQVGSRQCVLEAGGYIFNTEAHPIDPGALACCATSPEDWSLPLSDQLGLLLDPTAPWTSRKGKKMDQKMENKEECEEGGEGVQQGGNEAVKDSRKPLKKGDVLILGGVGPPLMKEAEQKENSGQVSKKEATVSDEAVLQGDQEAGKHHQHKDTTYRSLESRSTQSEVMPGSGTQGDIQEDTRGDTQAPRLHSAAQEPTRDSPEEITLEIVTQIDRNGQVNMDTSSDKTYTDAVTSADRTRQRDVAARGRTMEGGRTTASHAQVPEDSEGTVRQVETGVGGIGGDNNKGDQAEGTESEVRRWKDDDREEEDARQQDLNTQESIIESDKIEEERKEVEDYEASEEKIHNEGISPHFSSLTEAAERGGGGGGNGDVREGKEAGVGERNESGLMETTGATLSVSSSKYSSSSTPRITPTEPPRPSPHKKKVFVMEELRGRLAEEGVGRTGWGNTTAGRRYELLACDHPPFTHMLNYKAQMFGP